MKGLSHKQLRTLNFSNKYGGKAVLVFLCYIILFSTACENQRKNNTGLTADILIVGGTLLDGTGEAPIENIDVAVRGDSIIYIGKSGEKNITAAKTIDATGKYITPGFVDPHSHGDPLATPAFENFIAQGITTITLGQDGEGPETNDLAAWMDQVDSIRPGVNIAMMAGHGAVRNIAGVPLDGVAGPDMLQTMEDILDKAFDAGVYGMSTGLEYVPGIYATKDELHFLAKVVGKNKGLIMSHMRNEDDYAVDSSVRELISQGQFCKVHASHLKVVYGKGKERALELLGLLDSARKAGTDVTAEVYPYTASYTGIGIVFPEWAKPPNDYEQVKANRRKELKTYLTERVNYRNGPGATLLGTAPWTGRTLEQIADSLGKHFSDVLIDNIGPSGASGAYFVMDDELQETLLSDPHIMACTDGSPVSFHPRGHGSFAKIIKEFVLEKNLFPLETAVYKMSGQPAETLGISDRGVLRPGARADVLVFDASEVDDLASFQKPHVKSEGFQWVIINGKVVKEGQQISQLRFGRTLRKNQ